MSGKEGNRANKYRMEEDDGKSPNDSSLALNGKQDSGIEADDIEVNVARNGDDEDEYYDSEGSADEKEQSQAFSVHSAGDEKTVTKIPAQMKAEQLLALQA